MGDPLKVEAIDFNCGHHWRKHWLTNSHEECHTVGISNDVFHSEHRTQLKLKEKIQVSVFNNLTTVKHNPISFDKKLEIRNHVEIPTTRYKNF